MLIKLAWRNIWRNKRRSVIVLLSIIIGVITAIILDGLTNGMMQQMLFNQVNSGISHVQIHKKGFNDLKNVKSFIPNYRNAVDAVKNDPLVKYYSTRVITFGLISSATNSSGVYINGISPSSEKHVTTIHNSVIMGKYLEGNGREILLGRELADKLNVKLGDKVVAMANSPDGSVVSELFRVTGIYETYSSGFDNINIYINIESAQRMLNIGDNIHEIAVITSEHSLADVLKQNIQNKLGSEYEVLTYSDLLPLLVLSLDMYKQMTWIINLIVGLALIFGIINVMLMAVFERIKEFGILISVGLKSSKLFLIILTESFIIGVMGTVLGMLAGLGLQEILSGTGINLSVFAESLKSYGVGAVIYPVTSIDNLVSLLVMIPFISALAAIYPAYKAVKLEPVYAIRYI